MAPDSDSRVQVLAGIADVSAADWDALAGPQPFLRHAFLHALEASGCVSPRTGWTPRHLLLWHGARLAGAMPLYRKTHSWGEYVFDQAWADAHQRLGQAYYPKLLCAVPFTPVPGPRLLAADDASRDALLHAALALADSEGASSLHVLFPDAAGRAACARVGLPLRDGVQFHWLNAGYADFDAYLASLTRDKRKNIRQERRRVAEAGVRLEVLAGADITTAHWAFFHRCYCATYRARRSIPYLTLDFFQRLAHALPGAPVLVLARQGEEPIAAALNLRDDRRLYGRYWGALRQVPGLHFDACYYQGIAYCISAGLEVFEGGAQGEHKLARGFLPHTTVSAHWLRHPGLFDAVVRYLDRERAAIADYADELNGHSPFKAGEGTDRSD